MLEPWVRAGNQRCWVNNSRDSGFYPKHTGEPTRQCRVGNPTSVAPMLQNDERKGAFDKTNNNPV